MNQAAMVIPSQIVTLFKSVDPFCELEIPPPPLPLLFPLMVELIIVNVPSL